MIPSVINGYANIGSDRTLDSRFDPDLTVKQECTAVDSCITVSDESNLTVNQTGTKVPTKVTVKQKRGAAPVRITVSESPKLPTCSALS
jgi:hypothetical protein